ncbi:MAG: hypothetical protein WKF73_14060 [Nocardioidaceae bacterium]
MIASSASSAAGLQSFNKLGRVDVRKGTTGDIVAVTGLKMSKSAIPFTNAEGIRPLPRLRVDEPTLEMVFSINGSPLAGKGKYVTTQQLRMRLEELEKNVAASSSSG